MTDNRHRAKHATAAAVLTISGRGCREEEAMGGTPLLARDEQSADWVARAAALTPAIAAAADRIEAERRIVPEIVTALHDAGLFRMLLPVSFGGGGADIVAFNQVIETIAAADASTAWCLAQQVASTQAASFLDGKIAREIFAPPDGAVAWGPPSGAKAVVVDGGYVVNGRWRFASGSEHCPWLGGHSAVIEADGKPRLDRDGRPMMRTMLFRKDKAKFYDIWHVMGLRGTSSNAYEVQELFVPEAYSTWRDNPADRRGDEPLSNIPLLTLYGMGFSGVSLGLGRACLDAFMKLAETKKPSATHGAPIPLRDNPVIQFRVAEATGQLDSARAFLFDMLREFWDAATARRAVSLEQRARLRIAITGAMEQACRVVDFAYRTAGADAIFQGSPFERRFRDMHTVTAQGQAHLSNFEGAGQALFGIEPVQRL
jgi:alkylation response protein AidB-like acyl-CoA dehydrogenase